MGRAAAAGGGDDGGGDGDEGSSWSSGETAEARPALGAKQVWDPPPWET